jgi:hypothetical protein
MQLTITNARREVSPSVLLAFEPSPPSMARATATAAATVPCQGGQVAI